MTTTGEGEPREDGLGRGGDNPPPTNRATGAQGDDNKNDESIGGLKTAALLCPQRGTAADNGRVGTPTRHISGTDGARPEHSTLACREYGRSRGMREKQAVKTSGVRGNDRDRDASGMAHKSPGVGDKEGPRRSHQGVGRGVELPQGTNTPGVTEFPRGDETPE